MQNVSNNYIDYPITARDRILSQQRHQYGIFGADKQTFLREDSRLPRGRKVCISRQQAILGQAIHFTYSK
jgi:hypothetical protein